MSIAFKSIKSSDITITPFEANKTFLVSVDNVDSSSGVKVLEGVNHTSHFYPTEEQNSDGTYKRNIYHLVNKLYYKYKYSNVHTFNNDDTLIVPGTGLYYDTMPFPTTEGSSISHLLIPQQKFGLGVKPGSIIISADSGSYDNEQIKDDSKGNLYSVALSSSFNSKFVDNTTYLATASKFPTDPIVHWSFDTTGSIVYNEASTSYTDLTVTAGQTLSTGANNTLNYLDKSLSFTSESNHKADFDAITLELGHTGSAGGLLSGSAISWWMKRDSLTSGNNDGGGNAGNLRIFWGADSEKYIQTSVNTTFRLQAESNKANVYLIGANNDTGVTADTNWHHHVLSVQGAYSRYYIDGTQVWTRDMTTDTNWDDTVDARTLTISSLGKGHPSQNAHGNYFDGQLDEVRIFDRPLSASEVHSLYHFPDGIVTPNIGNVFYNQGSAVVTQQKQYNQILLGTGSDGFEITFDSTVRIVEHEYRCEIEDTEFNTTIHKSLLTDGNTGDMLGIASHSLFRPYVTAVGLYNQHYELLAVGKLARPIFSSNETPMTFNVRIDI
jgi:hypothetical protein